MDRRDGLAGKIGHIELASSLHWSPGTTNRTGDILNTGNLTHIVLAIACTLAVGCTIGDAAEPGSDEWLEDVVFGEQDDVAEDLESLAEEDDGTSVQASGCTMTGHYWGEWAEPGGAACKSNFFAGMRGDKTSCDQVCGMVGAYIHYGCGGSWASSTIDWGGGIIQCLNYRQ